MEDISAEQVAAELYQQGVSNFERGNYQQAIALLERARPLSMLETKLGGDILVWLANSYDAIGRTEEAIALCRSLKKHPVGDIRKASRYMLGILTAPQLSKLEGVVSEVPILESPDTYESKPIARSKGDSVEQKPFREVPLEKPNFNNKNNFLWFAIAFCLMLLVLWAK
ncbi:tetratricopeptide repeat protein [Pseudanabaena sp. FACHB-1998]|uniref:tetratricopeptide repeat protein n=1 Tax=Pseudanabaena sp. FACHB-1998 TaxID=2692858 RepID=UPI0016817C18|nr:tetratricopeptide repeat protein [Pseudanabaena sp. FACHB-1998]MBD2177389.1 tetratricopeptide repeat protein [Pseudanabaena sp. FACHB-1998]